MNIAFFETEQWEKEYLQNKIPGHTVSFSTEELTEETSSLAEQAEAISVFIYSQITKELLEKLPQLKLILTRSTGFDHIDLNYCKEKGITVCNVPEYGTTTVAEHTFALILTISRHMVESIERTRRGNFDATGLMGFDIYGKTLGVIGIGNIGKSVIRIAHGFGMNVLATSRHPDNAVAKELGLTFVEQDELFAQSDIVTLHVPYTPQTHHLINKETIKQFKKGSILINTARGGLVETEAIIQGLDEGNLSAYGTDVLEEECGIKEERQVIHERFLKNCNFRTQVLDHMLMERDNVFLTPHNAFHSQEALHKILDVTTQNALDFISGTPQNVVTEQS